MLRLSVLIPAIGTTEQLESSLVSVLEHQPEESEVVVVLTQPYNDPYDLRGEVRFVEALRQASLVDAVNLGLAVCQAPVVFLLGCGATVEATWSETALAHFTDQRVASVVPLVLDPAQSNQAVHLGVEYQGDGVYGYRRSGSNASVLGPSLSAGFYRISAIGRYSEKLDKSLDALAAATDLSLCLQRLGFRAVFEPRSRVFDPRPDETCRAFRRARQAELLYWRHNSENGRPPPLFNHGLRIVGEALRHLPISGALLAGRLVGALQAIGRERRLGSSARLPIELNGRSDCERRLDAAGEDSGLRFTRRAGSPAGHGRKI